MLRWLQAPASLLESSSRSAGSQYGFLLVSGFAAICHVFAFGLHSAHYPVCVMVLHGTTVARNLSRSPALRCPNDRTPWFDTLDGQWGNWQVPGGPSAVETSGLPASYDGRELCSRSSRCHKVISQFSQVNRTSMLNQVVCTGCRDCCGTCYSLFRHTESVSVARLLLRWRWVKGCRATTKITW